VTYGVAKRAAGVNYRTAPTIQISQRGGRSLYVELWDSRAKAQSEREQRSSRTSGPAKRLASFHFVKDGRYQRRSEHHQQDPNLVDDGSSADCCASSCLRDYTLKQ